MINTCNSCGFSGSNRELVKRESCMFCKDAIDTSPVKRMIKNNRTKGRLFKNIHTMDIYTVRFIRHGHVYFQGDETRGRQSISVFPNNFIRIG